MKVLLRLISVIVVIVFAACEPPTRPVATGPAPPPPPAAAPPEVYLPKVRKEQLIGILRATVERTGGVLEQSSDHHIVFVEPTTNADLRTQGGAGARLRYRFTVFEQDKGCRLMCEAWMVEKYGTPRERARDIDYGGQTGRRLKLELETFRDRIIQYQSEKKE